ncbi:hypothetical protein FPV67DRAFT_223866 [Lyophyllum atratum]|nr:hypothetical protein FPV67DRAFT_223866 [Lyophyllum atratum]
MLFGFFAWKSRRLIFKAPKSLGQTQIALFLTNGDIPIEINDEDAEKPVVWQVFNIGGAQREFMVEIPAVPGTGDVKLGFATIDEKESDVTVVQCRTAERAPARLIDENAWEHGDDDTDAATPVKVDPKARPKLTARNTSGFKTRIALGTYHEEEEKVRPLLLVEQFRGDEVYVAKDDLYLHAFRTNGYTSGQYGKAIVKDVIGDRLTESGGIRLSKLSPLTSWYIKSDSSGRLTVKIGRNSRKDVKAYRHECKIGKDVTKPVLV